MSDLDYYAQVAADDERRVLRVASMREKFKRHPISRLTPVTARYVRVVLGAAHEDERDLDEALDELERCLGAP